MPSALIPRAMATSAFVLAAYVVSGLIARAWIAPSDVWFLVLGADFLLVALCALLARIASNDAAEESSIEALGIGIGTVAPLCMHVVQFALQMSAGRTHAATDSVVGAIIDAQWNENADAIYLSILAGAGALSGVMATVGAFHSRQADRRGAALAIAIGLLVLSTMFLLPWFGFQEGGAPLPSLRSVLAIAAIAMLLWGSNALLRLLFAATRLAGQAALALVQIAIGVGIVIVVVLGVALFVVGLVHVAGPIFDLLRVVATALAWFAGAAIALLAVVGFARFAAGPALAAVAGVVGLFRRLSPRGRMSVLLACAIPISALAFLGDREGSRGPPPPVPTRITFREEPVACFGFRWEYGETDRISVPAANCLVSSEADIVVAVGSATPRGGLRSEPGRALQRGRTLADAIVEHFEVRQRHPRVFVLNRGIETPAIADDVHFGPSLAVLIGTVSPRGAVVDDALLTRDLSSYLRAHAGGIVYSHCDLYDHGAQLLQAEPRRLTCTAR